MSDFITDVERQYEVYCKIAEEHGFIDLNAKKNGFRCTTKSNEFNAGWIAFVGAVAAVRDEQQAIIDSLKAQLNNMEACYIEKKKERDDAVYLKDEHRVARVRLSRERDVLQERINAGLEKIHQFGKEGCLFPEWLTWAEKALRGAND